MLEKGLNYSKICMKSKTLIQFAKFKTDSAVDSTCIRSDKLIQSSTLIQP